MNRRNDKARGHCYEAAYGLMLNSPLICTEKLFLCHGVAVQSVHPHQPMGHGWIEEYEQISRAWFVRDGLFPAVLIPKDRYYAIGKIDPEKVVRYSTAQARHLYKEHGHCGPWSELTGAAAHATNKVSV
jgi:hypothetical protein